MSKLNAMIDQISFLLVERFFLKRFQDVRFDVCLPDGKKKSYGNKNASVGTEIQIHSMRVFRETILRESIGLAEAYMAGLWDCKDLTRFTAVVLETAKAEVPLGFPVIKAIVGRVVALCSFVFNNTPLRSLKNVQEHYDIGNEMYKLFLDPSTMSYTCALYRDPKELSFVQKPQSKYTLDQAQLNKIHYIIDKAGIKKGDRVLELGCGWGGFSAETAKKTGAKVVCYNLSIEQVKMARERAQEQGVAHLVTYVHDDYRHADTSEGLFDAIVSIGMLEHVGHHDLPNFFKTADRCLKPGGTAVVHTITSCDRQYEEHKRTYGFIQKYIFPGACIPAVHAIIEAGTLHSKFELQHFDNIGEHYALTLRDWRKNFYKNIDAISKLENGRYDASFVRMWDFYLCNCEAEFQTGHFGLGQFIWRRPSAEPRSAAQLDAIIPVLESIAPLVPGSPMALAKKAA